LSEKDLKQLLKEKNPKIKATGITSEGELLWEYRDKSMKKLLKFREGLVMKLCGITEFRLPVGVILEKPIEASKYIIESVHKISGAMC
jgi:hypothetical protein